MVAAADSGQQVEDDGRAELSHQELDSCPGETTATRSAWQPHRVEERVATDTSLCQFSILPPAQGVLATRAHMEHLHPISTATKNKEASNI